ncbi:MAG: hypothetical protein P4L55_08130 [Syntrophobacteraceae bacterium]|nr:hypothetical protein [Syntrophobacteraceae bacterium]
MERFWKREFFSPKSRPAIKAASIVLASLLICALAIPGMAAGRPVTGAGRTTVSRATVDLDLSSTRANRHAARVLNTRSASILVSGKPLVVTSRTRLTDAEMIAVHQVIDSGRQAIRIGAHGNAVGGRMVLTSRLASNLGSMVIPRGVTIIDKEPALALGGCLINSGSFWAVSSGPAAKTASITATNIENRQGGLITTRLPAKGLPGFPGAGNNLSLTLTASVGMTNKGTISSAGRLVMNQRGPIKNEAGALLQAANDVNLHSQRGAFTNTGLIASQSANINLSTGTASSDIAVNNRGGSLQAGQGAINIRDRSFNGALNTTLSGGDFLCRQLNVNSGSGAVNGAIRNTTGTVNVAAGAVRMEADARVLHVNSLDVAGDPILINTGGDINLDSMKPTAGNEFVAIASGNIYSGSGGVSIDTSSTSGAGGNVMLVAGAKAVVSGQSTIIQGRSATGGDINLGNLTSSGINTQGAPGGAVTLVAFAKTQGNSTGGHITLPSTLTVVTGGQGTAESGRIVMIGEAKSSAAWPVTIQTGNLDATGYLTASMILVETATPSTTSGPVSIEGNSASKEQSSNGDPVRGMFQFGTPQEGSISTGTLGAANDGGGVVLFAGSNAGGDPAISTRDISTSGTTGNGRVLLMAGATTTQTQANDFDITTGNIDTHSTTVQSGYPITVITPGAITTGSLNTSSALSDTVLPNQGGGGELTLVAGSQFKSNSGITVQGGINSSCGVSYSSQGVGAATITLIGLNAGSNITVTNPNGPAIDTSAPGGNSGAGAVLVATPGTITLQGNGTEPTTGLPDVINSSGSKNNTSGSQVFLSSGRTSGAAINILTANGAPGDIYTEGTSLGDGAVWVLTSGGDFTKGYTVNGLTNQNNFTDLCSSQALGPGKKLQILFQPGSSPQGYCPGGYSAIKDSSGRPTQINIVESANTEPVEVPILATGSAGINLKNKKSFIKSTYINGTSSNPSCTLKLFGAGPIVAPIGNGTPGQTFSLTSAVSTTGNIGISFVSSPIALYNTTATPGSLSLTANSTVSSYGQLVAGKSITIKTNKKSNGGFETSPITAWENFNIANTIAVSADGSGVIEASPFYCDKLTLQSQSGDICGNSGTDSFMNINAAIVQFNTSGEVDISAGWPAELLPSTGNPAWFTGDINDIH